MAANKHKKWKRLLAGGLLVAIGVCFVNAYAYGKVSGDRHTEQLDLGYKYLSELDYERAEITFENMISADETNYEAYLGLAEVYSSVGEPDAAAEILEEAERQCGYGEIQKKVVEAEAGLRQFRSMAKYNSGFEPVSGLTDFCVQGLDLFLGWVEKASTVVDGISAVWESL